MTTASLLLVAWVAASAATEGPARAQEAAAAVRPAQEGLPGVAGVPVRVENRLLVKDRRFFASAGLSYLSRGDYFISPGLSTGVSFYVGESHGVELRADAFLSWLSPGAAEIFNGLGLVPDAHRPVARLAAGYRYSLAYGKVLAFGALLIHFDLHAAAHAGVLLTDRALAPAFTAGPGMLVRLSDWLYLQLDVPLFASFEQRLGGNLSLGSLPSLAIGLRP